MVCLSKLGLSYNGRCNALTLAYKDGETTGKLNMCYGFRGKLELGYNEKKPAADAKSSVAKTGKLKLAYQNGKLQLGYQGPPPATGKLNLSYSGQSKLELQYQPSPQAEAPRKQSSKPTGKLSLSYSTSGKLALAYSPPAPITGKMCLSYGTGKLNLAYQGAGDAAATVETQLDRVLKKFDTDGDGAMSLEEVRGMVTKVCVALSIDEPDHQHLAHCFAHFDKNHDGELQRRELKRFLTFLLKAAKAQSSKVHQEAAPVASTSANIAPAPSAASAPAQAAATTPAKALPISTVSAADSQDICADAKSGDGTVENVGMRWWFGCSSCGEWLFKP